MPADCFFEDETLRSLRAWLKVLAVTQMAPALLRRVDASDLVQETLARAVAGRQQFRGSTDAEFRSWILKILARTLLNFQRDHRRLRRNVGREVPLALRLSDSAVTLDNLAMDPQPGPHHALESEERTRAIAEAVAALPDRQLHAIVLRDLQGWPLDRLSAELQLNPNACSALLFRARSRLASELRRRGFEPAPGRSKAQNGRKD